MFKKMALFLPMIGLVGCELPKPEYLPLNGESYSDVTIDTEVKIAVNKPVYFHTDELCSYDSAKLIGFVSKSDGPLYFKDEVVKTRVKSDSKVYLSLPLDYVSYYDANRVTIRYSQPIFSFIPEVGVSYKLVINPYDVNLYIDDGFGNMSNRTEIGELIKGCEITTENQGEGVKVFYLKPASG